jgi:hypothetical protein
MGGRFLVSAAIAALACGGAREAVRPAPEGPAPIDPPLQIERVFAGAIPVAASSDAAPGFREAVLRVLTPEPFHLVALRLDGVCRRVSAGSEHGTRPAQPAPGDLVRIGEAPGSDYRIGPAVDGPAPSEAPPWQSLLFYEAGGALRVIPFQFVHVGAAR